MSRTPLLVLALVLACLTAPAPADAAAKADYAIPSGAASLDGGRLTGAFVVRNVGGSRSPRITALMVTRFAGKDHVLHRYHVPALAPGASKRFTVSVAYTASRATSARVRVCADPDDAVREPSEGNNCKLLGTVAAASSGPTSGTTPSDPIAYRPDTIFSVPDEVAGAAGNYWAVVPKSYRKSKPSKLLIWLHGCGGQSEYEVAVGSPAVSTGGHQDWITISPGGREAGPDDDGCWDPVADQAKVYAALHDVETHFDIDRRRVVIGGYSAGGDLAYRTIFDHALRFAGLIAENTSPFRDTRSTQAHSLGEAAWKFNVVHLLHHQDDVYPQAGVQKELQAMTDAGFPVTVLQRDGDHYDEDTATTGTERDAETLLDPHLDDGWISPS